MTKFSKIVIMLFSVLTISSSLAKDTTKEMVLKVCSEQAKQAPNKEMQNDLLEACKCTVDKTDFAKVKQLEKAKDKKGLQALLIKVATECRK